MTKLGVHSHAACMSGLTLTNWQVHVMQRTEALPISKVEDNPQSSCPHFNAFMVQVGLYALASYTCYGIPVLFAACKIEMKPTH